TEIADPKRSPAFRSVAGRVPASVQRPPLFRKTCTAPPELPPGEPTNAQSPATATAAPKPLRAAGTPPSAPASVQAPLAPRVKTCTPPRAESAGAPRRMPTSSVVPSVAIEVPKRVPELAPSSLRVAPERQALPLRR